MMIHRNKMMRQMAEENAKKQLQPEVVNTPAVEPEIEKPKRGRKKTSEE